MPHIGLFCPRCREVELPPNTDLCNDCLLDQYDEEAETALHDRREASHASLFDTNNEYDENEYSRTPQGFTSSEDESENRGGMQNGDHLPRDEPARSPRSRSIFQDRTEERREIREGTRVGSFVNDDDDRDDEVEGEPNGHDQREDSDDEVEEDEDHSRRSNGHR